MQEGPSAASARERVQPELVDQAAATTPSADGDAAADEAASEQISSPTKLIRIA